ncbi:hypothetical protein [Teredinibacter turnerae]|uniref:hypothetical protein n=1 Tax=Teredinibacter turnerae TaxID=2426 RepID=UPI0003FC3E11|nr:hypothetical protein [Teredinibacter turnerae]
MHQFPEDYELIGFFEVEPQVLDADVPWAYNELTFNASSSNGSLTTKMVTGSELINICWYQDGNEVLHIDLKGVLSLVVGSPTNEYEINTLVISFRDKSVSKLFVKLRPYISVRWGYNDQQ